jgi:Ricin-type beta-trefoil lectin domain-like
MGGGELRLRAEHSGKCLDVAAFSTSKGGNLQVWSCSDNDSASQRNGQVRLFVDGNEVRRQDNLRLRGVSSGGLVSRFLFSTFYGGSSSDWAPSRTTYAYFDNIAVYPGLRVRSAAGGSATAR